MSDKFSVLLMRDDQHVRRLRISSRWIKFGIFFMVTVFLLALGGLYMGYTFWTKNKELAAERDSLVYQLNKMEVDLADLQEFEKFLESYDPELLEAMAAAVDANGEEAHVEEPLEETEPVDLNALLADVDQGRATYENLSLTPRAADDGLVVSFDLHNQSDSGPLAGNMEIELLGSDGQEIETEVISDELQFQIENYKTMDAEVVLPGDVVLEDVFALRLSIVDTDSGEVLHSRVYSPLSDFVS